MNAGASPFMRVTQRTSYLDEMNIPRDEPSLPCPRLVSNVVGRQTGPIQRDNNLLSALFPTFGQFLEADLVTCFEAEN